MKNAAVIAELALLKGQRDRLLDQARAFDRKIGHLAGQAVQDENATKSAIGRVLGISHTHVANLIAAADEQTTSPPGGIPVLDNVLAADYVRERGSRIVRSISAFQESDVLFQSGLDPRLFADDDYLNGLGIPAMLWQLDTGEWLGVGEATVGYGGTGCGYSYHALLRAGVDDAIAHEIIQWRFCDAVNLDDPTTWQTSSIWPVHARSTPRLIEDRIIVNITGGRRHLSASESIAERFRDENGQDPTGFYSSWPDRTPFEAWLDFLDHPGDATWAHGPRVARVFLDESTALGQGFAVLDPGSLWRSKSVPKIVIEQGHVQIWGHFLRPLDQNLWLPEEAYQALAQAVLYPAELAERDARNTRNTRPLRRLINTLTDSAPTQPFIDVSDTGTAHLAFTPRRTPDAD